MECAEHFAHSEIQRCHPRCDVRMPDAICYAANTQLQADETGVGKIALGISTGITTDNADPLFRVHLTKTSIVSAQSWEITFINIAHTTLGTNTLTLAHK